MLTELPLKLLVSSFGFIFSGMLMGNIILVYFGIIPLLFLISGLVLKQPTQISMEKPDSDLSVTVNDELLIIRNISVNDGIGLLTFGEELPKNFELLEGTNFKTAWKGLKNLNTQLRYKVKCHKRGSYKFDWLKWESRHPINMVPTIKDQIPVNQELIVKPRSLRVKRIRQQKLFTKIPMPAESRIKIGVPTTDFKELRAYSFGDSYKHINWKATARTTSGSVPIVNEYQKEGRRVVFIFFDTSTRLRLGSSIRNSFEYGVQAVLGLAEFYLSRQCMVGLSLFNSNPLARYTSLGDLEPTSTEFRPQDTLLFPEPGRMQQYKIHNMLIDTEIAKTRQSFIESLAQIRGHIRGTNPLFILVTNVYVGNQNQIHDGIRELSKFTRKTRKQRPNILLLNISGYKLAASKQIDHVAAEILEFEENAFLRKFSRYGISAVNWDPTEKSITEVLLAQVGRR